MPLNQGALNQGALNQGALNQGALNQGALNQGALNQGVLTRRRRVTFCQWTNSLKKRGRSKTYRYIPQDIKNTPIGQSPNGSVYLH